MSKLKECFSYDASWPGLARIVLWTLLFLFLTGRAFPVKIRDEVPFSNYNFITPALAYPDDIRLTTDRNKIIYCLGDPCIVWVADSSGVLYPPDKDVTTATLSDIDILPNQVLQSLGGDAGITLYLRISLRMLETYTLLVDALARNPALIVVSFNPIWVFTNYAAFKGNDHFNKASALWAAQPEAWPWLPLLTSPGNHLWAAAGQHIPVIKKSRPYRRHLRRRFGFAHDEHISIMSGTREKIPHISENSLILWILVDRLKGNYDFMLDENNRMLNNLWYREIIKSADLSYGGLNHWILSNIMALLRDSGVPALIYMAPLDNNDIKKDPEAWKKYQDIIEATDSFVRENTADNIRFIKQPPPDVLDSIVFKKNDNIHISDPGLFDDWLASEIDAMVKEKTK